MIRGHKSFNNHMVISTVNWNDLIIFADHLLDQIEISIEQMKKLNKKFDYEKSMNAFLRNKEQLTRFKAVEFQKKTKVPKN